MTSTDTRADRFVRELAALKIADPHTARAALWLRAGQLLMAPGLAAGVAAYFISHDTADALTQRDAIALGLGGVAAAVVGSTLYLRYSLTGFFRFWLARQSYDFSLLSGLSGPAELAEGGSEEEPSRDLATPETATR